MSHPARFSEDDPYLLRLSEIALALPGAQQKLSHGRPTFFTTKTFAIYGGLLRGVDHWDETCNRSLLFKPDPDEAAALLEQPHYFSPAYFWSSGWVGHNFDVEPDWALVAEEVELSYRNTAGKRLIAQLDARP